MCTCLKAITHMSLNTSVYRIDQISVLFIGDALFIIYFARFSPIWRPSMGGGYFFGSEHGICYDRETTFLRFFTRQIIIVFLCNPG